MRVRTIALIVAALSLLAAAPEKKVVVVVNKENPENSISAADLKRVYLGRLNKVGKLRAVPINQTLSSAIAGEFLSAYVDMDQTQYKEYWVAQQVKGLGVAPMVQKASVNVLKIVAELPGAVGYVYASEVDTTVKVLPVDE